MAAFRDVELQHTPEELEFFATDEEITIVPYFTLPTHDGILRLCDTDLGPFQPNFPVQVPLWLAIYLFQRKQCRIEPPEWLKVDNLQDVLEAERNTAAVFQPLPYQYLEITHVLLNNAKECFSARDHLEVRDLVEQIRRVRSTKINQGLELLTGALTAKLNNLCAMEINTMRPFFLGTLDRYFKMSKMAEATAGQATQTQDDEEAPGPRRQLRPEG